MTNLKDIIMLAALREDGRASFAEMSKKTGIPASTLFDKLRAKEGNLIKKHTALIDFGKLGFSTIVKVALKVDKKDRDSLCNFLLSNRNINSVYRINSDFDFFFEGIFRNLNELRDFKENLMSQFKIDGDQTFHIIEELKREDFLSNVERAKLAEGQR